MHRFKRNLFPALLVFLSTQLFSQVYNLGSLSVNVFDSKTKKPLKKVYNSLTIVGEEKWRKSMYTDSSGFCKFNSLPNRTYNFYCSGDSRYRSVMVDKIFIDNDSLTFNIYMKRKKRERFRQLIGRVNFHQGWRGMGEISLGIAQFDDDHDRLFGELNHLKSLEAGCQFNFNKNHFIIGPSITYNSSHVIFHYGGSLIYYTDFDKRTLFLHPHLGFSCNTYFDFYFGYNIPLMKNEMKGMVNRFTFSISVPLFDREWYNGYSKKYTYSTKKKKLIKAR